MISNEQIIKLAEEHLQGSDLYLTGVKISSDNHIRLFIDGDRGVSIKNCADLSRAMEKSLNREAEDFALDVSSHGADTPLILPRQYAKHLGRELSVKLNDGTLIEGKLLQCTDKDITLEVTSREPKTLGKGKTTVIRQHQVQFSEMKETKIKLKY